MGEILHTQHAKFNKTPGGIWAVCWEACSPWGAADLSRHSLQHPPTPHTIRHILHQGWCRTSSGNGQFGRRCSLHPGTQAGGGAFRRSCYIGCVALKGKPPPPRLIPISTLRQAQQRISIPKVTTGCGPAALRPNCHTMSHTAFRQSLACVSLLYQLSHHV
jgi:hypothetical protein